MAFYPAPVDEMVYESKVQQPLVDLNRLFMIESSNNPKAMNKGTNARGLGQITPIALQDFNQFNGAKKQYTMDDMFNPNVNREVAQWLVDIRIPQLLKSQKLPLNLDNVLLTYHSGIGNVKKGKIGPEGRNYVRKYKGVK